MSDSCSLVWFRQDLRLADNPALTAAAKRGAPVIALYILDDESPANWKIGAASRWWLHHSLESLAASLGKHGVPLLLHRGRADSLLPKLIDALGAEAVFWNRCYEPYAITRDTAVKAALEAKGVAAESFNGSLLHEPWTILTGGKTPFKVFTPYWRAAKDSEDVAAPLPVPRNLQGGKATGGDRLADWHLLPTKPDWSGGMQHRWQPGEAQAKEHLTKFLDKAIDDYDGARDRPGIDGTSALSPYLHHGEISPRQIWHAIAHRLEAGQQGTRKNIDRYLSELGWREFSYYLLYHFPSLPEQPFNEKFSGFKWEPKAKFVQAWQHGQTGYPIVDAGMRQLWEIGWMHNRVRMIVASFLIKHLRISWQYGAAWFWDTLVDADLASNSASWQWVAGSGADAAPYFRIFNPMLQSRKFDPDGLYIKRYVPELAGMPAEFIHDPWNAPAGVLTEAGIEIGKTYPSPLVDHGTARDAAMDAYRALQ